MSPRIDNQTRPSISVTNNHQKSANIIDAVAYYRRRLQISRVNSFPTFLLMFLFVTCLFHSSISDISKGTQNSSLNRLSVNKNLKKQPKQLGLQSISASGLHRAQSSPSLSDYLDGETIVSQPSGDLQPARNQDDATSSTDSDSDYNYYKDNGDLKAGWSGKSMSKTRHQAKFGQMSNNKHAPESSNDTDAVAENHHEHDDQHEDQQPNELVGSDNHVESSIDFDDSIIISGTEVDPFDDDIGLQTEKELLSSSLAERTCKLDRGCQRKDRLNNTYLSYCSRHRLELLLSTDAIDDIMHGSSETCERVLDEFIRLDEHINKFHESFKTLLQRYNCHNGYSVKWTCNDCKRAYKDWLCTTNLPFYMNGERVKPCISFCERVEQRCPYLHPITKEQYGGQPAFICKDPNIPFISEITPNTLHSEPGKCYDLCHLSSDKRELQIDSLSTYAGHCPSKSMIAEQVRDEDVYCQSSVNDNSTATNSDQHINRDISNNIGNKLIPCDHKVNNQSPMDHKQQQHDHDASMQSPNLNLIPSPDLIQLPLHCEKLNELSIIFDSYKSQPKGQTFSHHDR